MSLPGLAPPPPRRKRSQAQREAFEALRPPTRQDGVGEWWVDPGLEGAVLYHAGAGWRMRYTCTFRSTVDGELYIAGEIVGQGERTGLALGSTWSCRAERLRRVVDPHRDGP
jgi:hypothetical protein